MVVLAPKHTEEFLRRFLENLGAGVEKKGIDRRRIPRWIFMTQIRYGYLGDSLIAAFDDSMTAGVRFSFKGRLNADTVLLFDVENFQPTGVTLPFVEHGSKMKIWPGRATAGNIITMIGERPALFPYGFREFKGHHSPFAIFNLFIMHIPASSTDWSDVSARAIPFVLFVHKSDVAEYGRFWNQNSRKFLRHLQQIPESEDGEYYERLYAKYSNFSINKKNGVIILGKDSGPEYEEMIKIREYLRVRGYNADLIKELPDIREMSNDEKARFWTLSSRFCVMIDRIPSGHIKEYELMKQQRTVLAVLRPKGGGSTFMIGDDKIDVNTIRIFEFESSPPIDAIEEAIHWSEDMVKKRAEYFDTIYPWRKHDFGNL